MGKRKEPVSDGLPERLGAALHRKVVRTADLGGFRGGDEGIVRHMTNLSPRCAPGLATRLPRGVFTTPVGSGKPHGMAYFDGRLYFARGNRLYCTADGVAISDLGDVSDTDKIFFVFGDRLYLFPDKLYAERGGGMPRALELDTGVIEQVEFQGSDATLPEGMSWRTLGFSEGDGLRVVNADDAEPAPAGDYRITALHGRVATVEGEFPSIYCSDARFLRTVPSFQRVCVCGDRVYGICGREVYISAAGSATDFYSNSGRDGRGPAVLRADTEGDFTACASFLGCVICFKANRICKLMGSRSDSFVLQDTAAVGVPAYLANTLCEIGGALWYCSDSGVYRYGGQQPERVAPAGGRHLIGGCGGSDGHSYYLTTETLDGVWQQYLYDPEERCWYAEDDLHPAAMLCRDGFLWIQDGEGYVWLTASDGRMAVTSFDERSVRGPVVSSVTLRPDYGLLPEGCRPTGIFIRATAESGAELEVLADYADGRVGMDADGRGGVSVGYFKGPMTDRLLRIPLTPRLCDGMGLRLHMKGEWVIHEILRQYEESGR